MGMIFFPEGPDDSPQIFASYATELDVIFFWSAPSMPNGIISQYNLTVSVFSISEEVPIQITSYYISASDDETSYSYRVTGLVPYQNYAATVRAATSAGYGPEIETAGRTEPDSGLYPLLLSYFTY